MIDFSPSSLRPQKMGSEESKTLPDVDAYFPLSGGLVTRAYGKGTQHYIPPFIEDYYAACYERHRLLAVSTPSQLKGFVEVTHEDRCQRRLTRMLISVKAVSKAYTCPEWGPLTFDMTRPGTELIKRLGEHGMQMQVDPSILTLALPAWEMLLMRSGKEPTAVVGYPLELVNDVITCGTYKVPLNRLAGATCSQGTLMLHFRDGQQHFLRCQFIEAAQQRINLQLNHPSHRLRGLQVTTQVLLKHNIPVDLIPIILELAYGRA